MELRFEFVVYTEVKNFILTFLDFHAKITSRNQESGVDKMTNRILIKSNAVLSADECLFHTDDMIAFDFIRGDFLHLFS